MVGGTCVNRGCVPSKALLAVSGRMRELQSEHHLKALGLQVFGSSSSSCFKAYLFDATTLKQKHSFTIVIYRVLRL